MNTYFRHLDDDLKNHFKKYKEVLVLLGARQVGKTTILKRLFPDAYILNVDNESIRQNLERYDVSLYLQILPHEAKTIIIDEIHLLSDPGRAAKIIYDQIPKTKLIITGSSSLQIRHRTSESLAGRKIDYYLYPLTFSEYVYQKGITNSLNYAVLENIIAGKVSPSQKAYSFDISAITENILLYGLYPSIVNHPNDKIYLMNFIDSIIFKDLLDLKLIENRQAAINLLRLLAYQIGNLVNVSELASRLSINIRTVKRYLSIFEQNFVIFSLYPYAKKGRDEIGKMPKIYFYDTGVRNAFIGNFQPLVGRTDKGALFENFIIAEIFKENYYCKSGLKMNFWRSKQGSEIDLVLEKNDQLFGIEIKTVNSAINTAFKNRYPKAQIILLEIENFY